MFIFERSILLGFAFLFGLTACGSGEDSSAEDEATAATIAAALDVGSGVCDVDTDGDIDRLDINQILDARNTPASGSGDPRDADGNGSINVLDARSCTLRCTEPRCAIVDPVPKSVCDGDCFPNGVAAGDVDQTSVVLWARAEFDGEGRAESIGEGTVRFEYGRDEDFVLPPDGIEDKTVFDSNIPAKAPISGLLPGTQYYYRVCPDSCPPTFAPESEARGKFKTPHANGKRGLRFGVSSCFRGDMRPFFSIKNVPERDLDFFVALGDTVYADSNQAGQDEAGEEQAPKRSKTLDQFRDKHELAYSQLYSPDDNYFALARASTAFYVNIDDHEIVNNFAGGADPASQIETVECKKDIDLPGEELDVKAWGICFCDDVSENPYDPGHPLYDPDWVPNCDRQFINETDLFKRALLAWHEYNPIREKRYGLSKPPRTAGKYKLYRYRTFGKDAALFMLDARSFRDEPSSFAYDDSRTMLGNAQLKELKTDLLDAEDNGITWKIVLVPEPVQNLDPVTAEDRFEGYSHERGELLHYIEENGIANVVFISGDIHGTVVNNITYKRSLLDPQRFSSTWDISTGPAAYTAPLGHTITRVGPRPLNDPGDGPGSDLRHETLDGEFVNGFNLVLSLANNPLVGLGPETFRVPPLQQYNRNIPATPLNGFGSYVATHTYGWTEFEIADDDTQELTVTTYGMDWYDKPLPNDLNAYTTGEVEILRNRPQYIVSKFKVAADLEENGSFCARHEDCQSGLCDLGFCTAPNSRPALSPCFSGEACKNGSCTFGTCKQICGDSFCDGLEKCGGNDVTGLQCRSDCGQCTIGQVCLDDNMCESGLCNAGFCTLPQANGSVCVRDKGCRSGLCDLGFCTKPGSKDRGSLCGNDAACESGDCFLGFCRL